MALAGRGRKAGGKVGGGCGCLGGWGGDAERQHDGMLTSSLCTHDSPQCAGKVARS